MFIFPESISRLVFQYPTKKQVNITTQVVRFIGGGEQRYPIATPLRQWQAQPGTLPEKELLELTDFFLMVGGTGSSFQFTDIWDGTVYPVCYFKDNFLESTLREQNRGAVLFTIVEGRIEP